MTSNWGVIYDVDIIDGIKLCEMVWSQLDYNFFCLFVLETLTKKVFYASFYLTITCFLTYLAFLYFCCNR